MNLANPENLNFVWNIHPGILLRQELKQNYWQHPFVATVIAHCGLTITL